WPTGLADFGRLLVAAGAEYGYGQSAVVLPGAPGGRPVFDRAGAVDFSRVGQCRHVADGVSVPHGLGEAVYRLVPAGRCALDGVVGMERLSAMAAAGAACADGCGALGHDAGDGLVCPSAVSQRSRPGV